MGYVVLYFDNVFNVWENMNKGLRERYDIIDYY